MNLGVDIAEQESAIEQLKGTYRLRQADAVRRFLLEHPELIEVLLEARPHLKKHFGEPMKIALELVNDPEIENSRELLAYIFTPLSAEEALSQLDAFDEHWFLDQLERARGLLNFNLEFV